MEDPVPLVSVVLVNYRSGDLGALAAASAVAPTGVSVELIVVDNASDDGSLELLLGSVEQVVGSVEQVVVIRNEVNVGYAAAVNQGVRAASGSFVVPLNCDAAMHDGYLAGAVEVMEREPRVAVVAGIVEHGDGTEHGPQELTVSLRVSELPVSSPPGVYTRVDASCPVWRRAAIEEVSSAFGTGALDERFFVYGENVDLAAKLAALDWQCWFEPGIRASHVRSASSSPGISDKRGEIRSHVIASRWINAVRHLPARLLPIGLLWCAAEDLGFIVVRLLHGDPGAARDVVRGWMRFARGVRGDLAVRRVVRGAGGARVSFRFAPPVRTRRSVSVAAAAPAVRRDGQ